MDAMKVKKYIKLMPKEDWNIRIMKNIGILSHCKSQIERNK